MSKGILIFAHNSELVDYVRLSIISATLAKKNLNLPVTLVTDDQSLLGKDFDLGVFDSIVYTAKPPPKNNRLLDKNTSDVFLNLNRNSAWDLTPYDQTLLIDSDLLIYTNKFNEYWDSEESFLICPGMLDPTGSRFVTEDKFVSEKSIELMWATAIMFKKNKESKLIFDLVFHIRNNYKFYSDLYQFGSDQFRNDHSFSIAMHMANGFLRSESYLPKIQYMTIHESIVNVTDTGIVAKLQDNVLMKFKKADIHIMNKFSILDNEEALLRL